MDLNKRDGKKVKSVLSSQELKDTELQRTCVTKRKVKDVKERETVMENEKRNAIKSVQM